MVLAPTLPALAHSAVRHLLQHPIRQNDVTGDFTVLAPDPPVNMYPCCTTTFVRYSLHHHLLCKNSI